jgi:hypothetical protein
MNTKPPTPADRFTRRSQILSAAERALDQRIARRRALLSIAGAGAIATALFLAWFITPFKSSTRSFTYGPSHTAHPNNTVKPVDLAAPAPQWLTSSPATGDWLSSPHPPHDWLIGTAPEPDWLASSPTSLPLASDDEVDLLIAQAIDPEDRGIIRINGKLLLAKNLPKNNAPAHSPTTEN